MSARNVAAQRARSEIANTARQTTRASANPLTACECGHARYQHADDGRCRARRHRGRWCACRTFLVFVAAATLGACSTLLGPDVECHLEEVKGPPASVVPPDSLHLPTVTFQITQTKRVCTKR